MENTKFEDPFSEEVWVSTYRAPGEKSVDDTMARVARAVAQADEPELRHKISLDFYNLLSGFKMTPGGRIYANAGTADAGTTLMNCFAGPRRDYDIDSLDGILEHLRWQSQTLKSEGGWGDNFSYIRPRGAFIHGIRVESPGAVKYMELFDASSDIVTSGSGKKSKHKKAKGKIRKGAQMAVMDAWHPDVIEFITAKQSPGRLTKFNMSVNCTDDFMSVLKHVQNLKDLGASEEEIEEADQWELIFPETTHEKYHAEWNGNINTWVGRGYPVNVHNVVSATWLWNLITKSTYNHNEPGVLFLDRANYFNPLNYQDTIYTTNPCGEQTLAPGGVCDLGSINLTQFIVENDDGVDFDFTKFKSMIPYAVRFLDNINDISLASLPQYNASMKDKRRIGLGIMGWGSLLYMMKIRLGSDEASKLREEIMSTLARSAYMASIDLAEEKGMFPLCEPEKHAESPFIKGLSLSDEYMTKMRQFGIRNSSVLSIQPNGNTSILANIVSGGLEPIFMPEYVRTIIVNTMPDHITHVCPKWYEGEWHETDMFKFTKEGADEILKGTDENGVVYKIDKNRGLTKEVLCEDYGVRWLKSRGEWDQEADWAVSTTDLTTDDHINDMVGFAKWVDSAISKTVNIPNDYPFEDFKQTYLDAYNSGYIKGMTTYRAGTMMSVLSAKDEKEVELEDEEVVLDHVKMPDAAPASMKTIKAEGKKWYLTVVYNDGSNRPLALFVKTNAAEKTAQTNNAVEVLLDLATSKGIMEQHVENLRGKIKGDNNPSKVARCLSLLLRHGVLIRNIVWALEQVEDVYVGSFVFQVKKFLQSYIKDGEKVEGVTCEACGSDKVVFSEGCYKCAQCGTSKCG